MVRRLFVLILDAQVAHNNSITAMAYSTVAVSYGA